MRCLIRTIGRAATERDVADRRQWKRLQNPVKRPFRKVRSTRRAGPERVKECLARCREPVLRVESSLPTLAASGATAP